MSYTPETWEAYYNGMRRRLSASGYFHYIISRHVTQADRVLELGCGTGVNIPFITEQFGAKYYGIEGSETAVGALLETFPQMRGHVYHGDFTKARPFPPGFDMVIDRASMPHNDINSIRNGINMVYDILNPGGLFIASDWFSTWHSEFVRGERVEEHTRDAYEDGQFYGVGKVHFFDDQELDRLFDRFEGISLEERVIRRPAPGTLLKRVIDWPWISRAFDQIDYRSAVWDIVVRKPL